jgi:hypothetical protein
MFTKDTLSREHQRGDSDTARGEPAGLPMP